MSAETIQTANTLFPIPEGAILAPPLTFMSQTIAPTPCVPSQSIQTPVTPSQPTAPMPPPPTRTPLQMMPQFRQARVTQPVLNPISTTIRAPSPWVPRPPPFREPPAIIPPATALRAGSNAPSTAAVDESPFRIISHPLFQRYEQSPVHHAKVSQPVFWRPVTLLLPMLPPIEKHNRVWQAPASVVNSEEKSLWRTAISRLRSVRSHEERIQELINLGLLSEDFKIVWAADDIREQLGMPRTPIVHAALPKSSRPMPRYWVEISQFEGVPNLELDASTGKWSIDRYARLEPYQRDAFNDLLTELPKRPHANDRYLHLFEIGYIDQQTYLERIERDPDEFRQYNLAALAQRPVRRPAGALINPSPSPEPEISDEPRERSATKVSFAPKRNVRRFVDFAKIPTVTSPEDEQHQDIIERENQDFTHPERKK